MSAPLFNLSIDNVMLVNASEPGEIRIAIIEKGTLQEYFIELTARGTLVGNLYKGRVLNVVPNLQAAFVSIGLERNAFLHVTEVVSPRQSEHRRGEPPQIRDLLQAGYDVLVQVIRDGIGEKGPSVSMDISIAGRNLVLTPRSPKLGVSKRIADPAEREALRAALGQITLPPGLGFIVRTAGADQNPQELVRDADYLTRVWNLIVQRAKAAQPPALIYQESDLVIRTIRDLVGPEIKAILIDSPTVFSRTHDFFQAAMPRYLGRLVPYKQDEPLFYHARIEEQIEALYHRMITLPSGGWLKIEQTEALTAIDVNSGKFKGTSSAEELAYRTNMEAAREIPRYLRLLDIGGVIAIDFIDMRDLRHRLSVERALREEARNDRAKTTILRLSRLGMIEMAREKVRPGVRLVTYEECEHCTGTGMVKNLSSMAAAMLRRLRHHLVRPDVRGVKLILHPKVALYMQNDKRKELSQLEERFKKAILIDGNPDFGPEKADFLFPVEEAPRPEPVEGPAKPRPGTERTDSSKPAYGGRIDRDKPSPVDRPD